MGPATAESLVGYHSASMEPIANGDLYQAGDTMPYDDLHKCVGVAD